ncbi:MAG: hypothetical protein RL385_23 [Pseudomonadota bacterium]|jgi:P-type conjugative transfer protein TrbJ
MKIAHRKVTSRLVALTVAVAVASTPVRGRAGAIAGGASEWTQVANNIQLVMQLINQIMMVKRLINQVKMMAKMTKSGKLLAAISVFQGFSSILANSAVLAFAGVKAVKEWQKTHPGEKAPDAAGYETIDKAYVAMDRDLHATAQRGLAVLDIQTDKSAMEDDQNIMEELKDKMETAEGQMQAQQAANEILLELVRQLNLLRQVLLVQSRLVAATSAEEAQRRMYARENRGDFFKYTGKYRGKVAGFDPSHGKVETSEADASASESSSGESESPTVESGESAEPPSDGAESGGEL